MFSSAIITTTYSSEFIPLNPGLSHSWFREGGTTLQVAKDTLKVISFRIDRKNNVRRVSSKLLLQFRNLFCVNIDIFKYKLIVTIWNEQTGWSTKEKSNRNKKKKNKLWKEKLDRKSNFHELLKIVSLHILYNINFHINDLISM